MRPASTPHADLVERILAARPAALSMVAALAAVTAAFVYAFAGETPVGEISGRVYSAVNRHPIPGARVYLNPATSGQSDDFEANDSTDIRANRYVRSGPDGSFRIRNIPAGDYQISASGRAHAGHLQVTVQEGENNTLDFALNRTRSGLAINEHQSVFGTNEEALLPVSGYADDTAGKTDSMQVQLYHARVSSFLANQDTSSALSQIGQSDPNDSNESLPASLLKPEGGQPPVRVLDTGYRVRGADREGFFYQNVSFGRLPTGLYLVNIRHAGNASCAWLMITDMALVVKRAGGQLVAYATGMQSGKPLPGVNVSAYRDGHRIAVQRTDTQGLAQLAITEPPRKRHDSGDSGDDDSDSGGDGSNQSQSFTTLASNGDDEALVSQNLYMSESEGAFRVCTYTDRPIYRPGQTVQFKGIVRSVASADSDSYRVPGGEPVRVEMRSPAGDRIYDQRATTNGYGAFHGVVDLSSEAATGVYTIVATVRGQKYTQDVTIASYHKPEFAVTVTPDTDHVVMGTTVRMTISANYYFGAPVAGAKIDYSIDRSPDWAADYADDYDYDDSSDVPTQSSAIDRFYGEAMESGTAVLDANGKAVVTVHTQPHSAYDTDFMPEQDVYSVTATVHDQNREVTETGQVKVSAGSFQLTVSPDGYVAAPGKPIRLIIHAATFDHKPVPNLPVQIELQRHHWSDGDWSYQRAGLLSAVTGPDGYAYTDVTPRYAGSLNVRASALDPDHHRVVNATSLYVASDDGGDLDVQYTDLQVLTDKRHYMPGDTARVLINASRSGEDVLLTIEGNRVFHAQLVEMAHRSMVVRLPVLASYGPNVFIDACYVRNKHYAQSEAPLRVNNPQQDIHLAITPDRPASPPVAGGPSLARYEPGNLITYRIHATNSTGAPARCDLSFGVVDESIYALREDDPNHLRDAFYPHRTNQVETGYSFAIEYLGDANKAEPQISARKRFPDTAYWDPDIETNSQGDATVAFHLPDNLTTWRATAIAQTMDTRLGRETQKVIVSKPFFVRLEAPRYLTQTDEAVITALVHNETAMPQTATVRLRTENLQVEGDSRQEVTVPAGGMTKAIWNVSVAGTADATLNVATWTAPTAGRQYTDAIETTLPVRPHGREHMVAYAGSITDTDSETEVLRLDPGAIPSASRLTIRIDQSPANAIAAGLDYLIGFPYGCTEQTMSRMMPDILVQEAVRRRVLPDILHGKNLPKMVNDSLQRLYRFQHDKGGWGWWKQDADDAYMTAYVLYGLSVAREAGYAVSDRVVNLGLSAAKELYPKASNHDKAALAYAVAHCGDRVDGQNMAAVLPLNKLDAAGLAYSAMTFRLLGFSDAAPLQLLGQTAVESSTMLHWSGNEGLDWNGVEATSLALQAIMAANPQDPRVDRIVRWLMQSRTGDIWYSTADTAAVTAAMCTYLTNHPPAAPGGEVRISVNGREIQQFNLSADTLAEKELVFSAPVSVLRPQKNDVLIERLGSKAQIFYSVALRETVAGSPLLPTGPHGCEVTRKYMRYVPSPSGGYTTQPTEGPLPAGSLVKVQLTISVPRDMDYVLVEDPFPAGCEPQDSGDVEESDNWDYWWCNTDTRDDRVAFFARYLTKGVHTIQYYLSASTPGTYHALPTLVQPMYEPDTRIESGEGTVVVR